MYDDDEHVDSDEVAAALDSAGNANFDDEADGAGIPFLLCNEVSACNKLTSPGIDGRVGLLIMQLLI